MKQSEAFAVLAKVAAFDRRTVGNTDSQAWAEALKGYGVQDCLDAVGAYFRASSAWLMPFGVIEQINVIHRRRVHAVNQADIQIPENLHQADERDWKKHFWDAVKAGEEDPHGAADAVMQIGPRPVYPPRPDRVALIEALAQSKAIPTDGSGRVAVRKRPKAVR